MKLQNVKIGDKLVWKKSWGGFRFKPGPFTVKEVLLGVGSVKLEEGNPPYHQYHYDSFFTYAYARYECPNCGHVGYLKDQSGKTDVICGQCYSPTQYVRLVEKS